MVMAAFTPQYVGQEFVRQYYTMLNKDPLKLHSFYVSHSVFTHGVSVPGKVEKPVTGLEAIRDKICQLNFQNCRANIRSLDSHPTIGGGVVVQVSGELSNADCPMRKFTQTFVLAPQDPQNLKKYFVFNDIFRYQDEVFDETEDETHEETVESYAEEPVSYESNIPNHHIQILQPPQQVEQDIQKPFHDQAILTDTLESVDPAVEEPMLAHPEEEQLPPAEELPAVEDTPQLQPTEDYTTYLQCNEDNTTYNESLVEDTEEQVERPPSPVSNEPVSWASVLKKNSAQAQGAVTKPPPPTTSKHVQSSPSTQHIQPQPQQQQPQKRKEELHKTPPREDGSTPPRKPQGMLADNCQIFIGNLPSGIQENDVVAAFKEFGKIVEVRLNSKSFGFVAFDNPDSAQNVLDLPKGKIAISGQEINIEKKRPSAGSSRPYNRRDRSEPGPQRKSSGPGAGRSQWGGSGRGGRGGHQDSDRPARGGRGGRDRNQR